MKRLTVEWDGSREIGITATDSEGTLSTEDGIFMLFHLQASIMDAYIKGLATVEDSNDNTNE